MRPRLVAHDLVVRRRRRLARADPGRVSLILALLQGAAGAAVQVTVDADGDAAPFPHFWKRAFGSGHAALGLRDDWQDAVARAARDYGLGGLRFHGIFDDDM